MEINDQNSNLGKTGASYDLCYPPWKLSYHIWNKHTACANRYFTNFSTSIVNDFQNHNGTNASLGIWIQKPKNYERIRRTAWDSGKIQAKHWLYGHLWSIPEKLALHRVDVSWAAHVLSCQMVFFGNVHRPPHAHLAGFSISKRLLTPSKSIFISKLTVNFSWWLCIASL